MPHVSIWWSWASRARARAPSASAWRRSTASRTSRPATSCARAVKAGSPLGREVAAVLRRGRAGLGRPGHPPGRGALRRARRRSAAALLDGFPRTLGPGRGPRARCWATTACKLCVNLDVPIELVTAAALVAPRLPGVRDHLPRHRPRAHLGHLREVRRRRRPARRRPARGDPPAPRDLRARHRAPARLLPRRGACWSPSTATRAPDEVTDAPIAAIGRAGPGVRRSTDELAKMRRAGRVVAEMHEATRAAIRPGVTTAAAQRGRGRGARAARRALELPQLPRVPRGHLHEPQRHDRPRHPRRLRAARGRHHLGRLRGDRRGLPRRRRLHRGAWARSATWRAASDRGDRALAVGRHRPDGRRQSPPRGRPRRPGRRRGRRILGGARVRRPRHRHGDARESPGAQLLAGHARARR